LIERAERLCDFSLSWRSFYSSSTFRSSGYIVKFEVMIYLAASLDIELNNPKEAPVLLKQ